MAHTFSPLTVQQVSTHPEDIGWESRPTGDDRNILGLKWVTTKNLTHYANLSTGDLRSFTSSLILTNFQITDLPSTITGVSILLKTQRNGRVFDETIQLVHLGNDIGENNFYYESPSEGQVIIKDEKVYGGETDLWGAELTPAMLADPTFGVRLRFQSHPFYPHNSGMTVEAVTLTVY